DRVTFEELLRSKRLRPVSGQGTIQFFRASDVAKLRAELHPDPTPEAVPAEAAPEGETPKKTTRKPRDPAMSVHQRLTADLKWYDISDEDLKAFVDQLHPESYGRRRNHAVFLIERMQRLIALIDESEARLATSPPSDARE